MVVEIYISTKQIIDIKYAFDKNEQKRNSYFVAISS